MSNKSLSTPAIIIKRRNWREADLLLTVYAKEMGKIVCLAKGARRLNSRKKSFLEPGNIVQLFLIETKSWPLLTQVKLLTDLSAARRNLLGIRRLNQVLEFMDMLFIEEEDAGLFFLTEKIMLALNHRANWRRIRQQLEEVLLYLGYPSLKEAGHFSINEYLAVLTQKKPRSFQYLTVRVKK